MPQKANESLSCHHPSLRREKTGEGIVMLTQKFGMFQAAAWMLAAIVFAAGYSSGWAADTSAPDVSPTQSEPHLGNIRQLTFAGKNAEAYFSFEGDRLVYQSTLEPDEKTVRSCYQIYVMNLDGSHVRRVSMGTGGTTCGYFFPGGRRALFSSTHHLSPYCPPEPPRSERYRWALHPYDLFSMNIGGRDLQRLTANDGYDAEATVSPDGRSIVFTSLREGDLDVYSMDIDGQNLKRLTQKIGYDGGAFYSPDSQRIVYRANHPSTEEELTSYQKLLADNLVEPSHMEIFIMNADGSDQTAITDNGKANFAPYFLPDGKRIIFSSNLSTPSDHQGPPSIHLYVIHDDGSHLEQITTEGTFNSFPMFSPDGTKLVWSSDRNATTRGEYNIFLADWIP